MWWIVGGYDAVHHNCEEQEKYDDVELLCLVDQHFVVCSLFSRARTSSVHI